MGGGVFQICGGWDEKGFSLPSGISFPWGGGVPGVLYLFAPAHFFSSPPPPQQTVTSSPPYPLHLSSHSADFTPIPHPPEKMLKNANSDSNNSCNDNNITPLFHPASPNSNSSIPPFQCQFPAKTPKDEQQLSVAFGGPQICFNGTFPLAERSAAAPPPEHHHTTIEQNLCQQRSAHSAAAQMAHAMAQQLAASVYGPNASAKLDAPHCAQFLPPSSDRLAAPSHCSTSSGINAFLPLGPTAVVQPSSHPSSSYCASELPQPVVPYPVSASTSASGAPPNLVPIRRNTTIAQLESPASFLTTAAMIQQQSNASGGSMYHHPNFVQHSPCVVDASCSSSSTYSTCFNPSNCAPSSAVFFPHMPNEFYGYYHPQCRPFLQHLSAAVVPNNSSTSSSSTSSELEHGGAAAVHVGRWRDSEEERRGLSGQAVTTAASATAIRRAESGTFPGLCPQPRHAVGPGTNNVRVRTKDTYRVVYSECQRLELEREFTTQKFISSERKAALSARLRLTERQIKIWFQNRRAKERRHERRFQTSTINF